MYVVKKKPKLDPVVRKYLELKLEMKRRQPDFVRYESHKVERIGTSWRRPRGYQNKMRRHFAHKPPMVDVGYRSPRIVRDLHPSGFKEVLVCCIQDLEKIDPEKEAARISGKVGKFKRIRMERMAAEKGIRVLNPKYIRPGPEGKNIFVVHSWIDLDFANPEKDILKIYEKVSEEERKKILKIAESKEFEILEE